MAAGMHPEFKKSSPKVARAVWAGAGRICCVLWVALGASALLAQNPSGAQPITISLAYQEARSSLANWAVSVTSKSSAFQREPDVSEGDVRRGWLSFSPQGEPRTAFFWDLKPGSLHLDLNGNEDLTDDTNGVFTFRDTSVVGGRYGQFTDVRLSWPTPDGPCPVLVDLTLTAYGSVRATASLRSFYSGKVTLAEREWQIGVVDKPCGQLGALEDAALLLRPWEETNKVFQVESGMMDAFRFATNLFFQGRGYRVKSELDLKSSPARCRLELTEQPVTSGEVRFTGQFIRRAILKDGPWTAVLDEPSGSVQVPVGDYGTYQVCLQNRDAGACLDVWPADRGIEQKRVVAPDRPMTLAVGGPLTNTVAIRRRGNLLILDYRLVGVGGEAYRLVEQDRSKPPRFEIYRDDKQIASGNFEYG